MKKTLFCHNFIKTKIYFRFFSGFLNWVCSIFCVKIAWRGKHQAKTFKMWKMLYEMWKMCLCECCVWSKIWFDLKDQKTKTNQWRKMSTRFQANFKNSEMDFHRKAFIWFFVVFWFEALVLFIVDQNLSLYQSTTNHSKRSKNT